jgi:hypothetical protein
MSVDFNINEFTKGRFGKVMFVSIVGIVAFAFVFILFFSNKHVNFFGLDVNIPPPQAAKSDTTIINNAQKENIIKDNHGIINIK